jgi:hypothetical protein
MKKLPECERCHFNAHSPHTVCAVHPFGVDGDNCLDFREDPNVEPEELWEPEGASYIDDELVLERSYYNGEEIRLAATANPKRAVGNLKYAPALYRALPQL